MFEILPESRDANIGFKVSGEITAADYDALLPKLDEAITAHGKINLLVLVEDFDFKSLDAAKKDFQFGTNQYRQVEKAAYVGDKKWQGWMIKILGPFTRHTKERFFDVDQLEDAWSWIKEE